MQLRHLLVFASMAVAVAAEGDKVSKGRSSRNDVVMSQQQPS